MADSVVLADLAVVDVAASDRQAADLAHRMVNSDHRASRVTQTPAKMPHLTRRRRKTIRPLANGATDQDVDSDKAARAAGLVKVDRVAVGEADLGPAAWAAASRRTRYTNGK